MRFGSISYLNLLPFQLFLKRHLRQNQTKQSLVYKRAIPSQINHAFNTKRIDAGFISSVHSKNKKCTNLGIVAYKKVYSVLLLKGENQNDPASATSNLLVKVLGLQGKVLIGDAALKHYLTTKEGTDLAEAWYEKTELPFVFARLCYNKHGKQIQKLSTDFTNKKTYLPQYILKKEAKKRGLRLDEVLWYLTHIHYNIDNSANKGLKKFLKEVKKL